MPELDELLIVGSDYAQFSKSLTAAIQALPPEHRKRLHEIHVNCIAKYGFDGTYERMDNRTVAQILVEFESLEVKPIASGEESDVRWALHEAPSGPGANDEKSQR
jgi:hypothetical protein